MSPSVARAASSPEGEGGRFRVRAGGAGQVRNGEAGAGAGGGGVPQCGEGAVWFPTAPESGRAELGGARGGA